MIGDVALVPSAEPLPLARDLTQPPVCSLFTDQRGKWRGIAPSGTRFRFRIRYPDFLAERVGSEVLPHTAEIRAQRVNKRGNPKPYPNPKWSSPLAA